MRPDQPTTMYVYIYRLLIKNRTYWIRVKSEILRVNKEAAWLGRIITTGLRPETTNDRLKAGFRLVFFVFLFKYSAII